MINPGGSLGYSPFGHGLLLDGTGYLVFRLSGKFGSYC